MADGKFDRKAAVLKRMADIPDQIKDAVRAQLDTEGAFLVEQIRPAVPKDKGELAESLEWHRNPSDEKIGVIVTEGLNLPGDPENRTARAQEFGRPDMPAQPHFFPTYRAHKKKMKSRVMSAARKQIRLIWGTGKVAK